MEECSYCEERDRKLRKYEEDIEMEKLIECKKALEREKIAKGMQCTRVDEIQLRAMQKLQIQEKKNIEREAREVDNMWHQVLLNDLERKEEIKRRQTMKLREEMKERRKAYDDQISSANRERQETLKREREQENLRHEKIKQKMEQDYYNTIKSKKDQQVANRSNFIIGHKMKLDRLEDQKKQEREFDDNIMKTVAEEIRIEKQKQLNQMRELQQQKSIFMRNYLNERMMAAAMEKETDKVIYDWERTAEMRYAERKIEEDMAKKMKKEKALQDYRQHLENINLQTKRNQQERKEQMERVKNVAYSELERKLCSANEELKKQIAYRNSLTDQIRSNKKILETKLKLIEYKQQPFTKKAISFKEAMRDKVNTFLDIESTNPVHPFARVLQERQCSDAI